MGVASKEDIETTSMISMVVREHQPIDGGEIDAQRLGIFTETCGGADIKETTAAVVTTQMKRETMLTSQIAA